MKSISNMWSRLFAGVIGLVVCSTAVSSQIVVNNDAEHLQSVYLESNTISAFETASGANRKLVVVATWENGGIAITNITYGSQTFSEGVAVGGGHRRASIWYLDAPDVGTQDVVVMFDGTAKSRAGVLSLQNAAWGVPAASDTLESSVSIDLTTPASNTFVVGAYIENNGLGAISSLSFLNNLYNGDSGSCTADVGYQNEEVPGLKTYTWDANTNACAIAIAGFLVAPPSTTLAVDFGGDYRDGNQNAAKTLTYETGDYDLGGMDNDRRGYRTLDNAFLKPILIEAGKETGVAGKNKNIYAGYQVVNLGVLTDPPVSANYKYAGSAADQLVAFSGAGTTRMSHVFTPHVKKENFLNGLNDNAYNLSFENVADSVSFDLDQLLLGGIARALVLSGADWYVSDTELTATGSLSVNGYTETWHPYDPTANQFLDVASLGSGVSGSTLTDIQAVGVLAQKLDFNGVSANASRFGIGAIMANMEQTVAPSTVAIDFGGDYNDDNQKNTDALTVGLGDYDFGANAIDDYAARREITDAYISINNVNGLTNKTTVFFEGAQYVNFDNVATAPVVTQNNYKWRGLSDVLTISFDSNQTTNSGLAFAPYVKKSNFLNGFDSVSQTLGFEDAAGSVAFNVGGVTSMARALVQSGSDWYVSDTIAAGSFSVNGYTEIWHAYDPTSNLFLDEGNLDSGVEGSILTDIQAAGVLVQKMNFDATANFTFNFSTMTLKVVESVIPTIVEMVTDDFNRANTAWSSNGSDIRSDWVIPSSNLWRINGNQLEADIENSTSDTPSIYNDTLHLPTVVGSSFAMRVDVTASTNEQWCGVVFNYQNPSNYCMVRIKTGFPNYHYIVTVDGVNVAQSLNTAPENFEMGTAYTFTVVGAGSSYTIEITEAESAMVLNPVTAWAPATTLSGGYAGLFAPDGNLDVEMVPDLIFDNFSLSISVPLVTITYDEWISGYSVGSLTNLLDDFDLDGMNHLIEYALGGNPELDDAADILPVSYLDDTGASNVFAYVYNRRLDPESLGLSYEVQRDTDLVFGPEGWTTNGVTDAGSVVVDSEFEEVTATVPVDVGKRFLRLRIGQD